MGRPKKEIVEKDFYNIREDWEFLKQLVLQTDPDVSKFLRSTAGKNASIRARKNLNDIRKLCEGLRKGILFQRQDNENDF